MDKKTVKSTVEKNSRCKTVDMFVHGYPWWISIHVHGYPFQVSMEYPWMFMDIHGYPWISMDIHDRCDVDKYGYPFVSICIHLYPWISIFFDDTVLHIDQIKSLNSVVYLWQAFKFGGNFFQFFVQFLKRLFADTIELAHVFPIVHSIDNCFLLPMKLGSTGLAIRTSWKWNPKLVSVQHNFLVPIVASKTSWLNLNCDTLLCCDLSDPHMWWEKKKSQVFVVLPGLPI